MFRTINFKIFNGYSKFKFIFELERFAKPQKILSHMV